MTQQVPPSQTFPCDPNGTQLESQPAPQGPPPPYSVPNFKADSATSVVTTTTRIPREITVVMKPPLGMDPKVVVCPRCRASVVTQTSSTPGLLTYLLSTLLCLCGCVFGCCLIPCCMDETQDTEHRCPRCRFYFGKHRQLQ